MYGVQGGAQEYLPKRRRAATGSRRPMAAARCETYLTTKVRINRRILNKDYSHVIFIIPQFGSREANPQKGILRQGHIGVYFKIRGDVNNLCVNYDNAGDLSEITDSSGIRSLAGGPRP